MEWKKVPNLFQCKSVTADVDLSFPSRLVHRSGYGTASTLDVLAVGKCEFQPRNSSKYLVAATSPAVLAASAGPQQIIL